MNNGNCLYSTNMLYTTNTHFEILFRTTLFYTALSIGHSEILVASNDLLSYTVNYNCHRVVIMKEYWLTEESTNYISSIWELLY